MNHFFDIFSYSFMIRAFIAGGIIGITAPLIGTFLVTKRYSLMADSLSHIALMGLALGLLFGVCPLYLALITTVIVAIGTEFVRSKRQISGDIALTMFMYAGLATALVLISFSKGFSVDLFSYLFGSITTVNQLDIRVMSLLGLSIILTVYFLYNRFLYITLSEEAALVSGIPVRILNTTLVILTAITVSVSLKVVGLLLIGALMVIPVVSSMQVARSFKQMMILASLLGFLSVIIGLFIAYFLNTTAGGTIVLTSFFFFFICVGYKYGAR